MGPWFGRGRWFGPWFDSNRDSALFAGYGPAGAATFVLDMESGFTTQFVWETDIIPRKIGTEQRISNLDAPKQFYSGIAKLLTGSIVGGSRWVRSKLALYAASGAAFLIGIPYEEMTFALDSVGTTVYVNPSALAMCDWKQVSQRVVIVGVDGTTMSAVLQAASGSMMTLDAAPGAAGKAGGRIMPAMAVILDPQQTFQRHTVNVEEWNVRARAAVFDFASQRATLALGPVTSSAALDNVVITSRLDGVAGNSIRFQLFNGGPGLDGVLAENGNDSSFAFWAGVTTLGQMKAALDASRLVQMTGTWNDADVINGADALVYTNLTGGTALGTVGTGATLTMYDSRPVWDREINHDGTAGDQLHSLHDVLDMAARPYSVANSDYPEWGREIALTRNLGIEWQWFKLFCDTVRGRQRAFWLPSYRDDFTHVSNAANTVTVSNTDGGDIFTWWPYQRDRLQIEQADGTITRCKITNVANNGNGTVTLTTGVTLSGSTVTRVSWLELCRFEEDAFTVTFTGPAFSVQTRARVIRA
jgi:hypothetical protein